MVDFLRGRNPNVAIHHGDVVTRRSRLSGNGPWAGKPVETMAQDVRTAYDKAAAGAPGVKGHTGGRGVDPGDADGSGRSESV